ncbi:MAG TPA: hypothetical protein VND83_08695 [Acidimicrobiales bacterium]|nr:hypothetical protein [Acidimicrobiales bacterium]
MLVSKKVAAAALAAVALALTVTGVVLAVTDPNAGGNQRDPLALNGYPPRTAQLHVVISTGQAYNVTADVNVDFVHNTVGADLQIPLLFSATNIELRLVARHLYVASPNLGAVIGSNWLSTKVSIPSLYGLSLEMTRPDVGLISGFPQMNVTHSGYLTTYRFHRDNVAIATPSGLPFKVPAHSAIDFSITLGKQGELAATSFKVTSKHSTAWVIVTVTSYNAPTHIIKPPAKDVTALNSTQIGRIFGSTSIGNLFNPKAITSLGQIRLS